jgi:hypothetical protein
MPSSTSQHTCATPVPRAMSTLTWLVYIYILPHGVAGYPHAGQEVAQGQFWTTPMSWPGGGSATPKTGLGTATPMYVAQRDGSLYFFFFFKSLKYIYIYIYRERERERESSHISADMALRTGVAQVCRHV